jgi:hypothetical protein
VTVREYSLESPTTLRVKKKLVWPSVTFLGSVILFLGLRQIHPSAAGPLIVFALILAGVELAWWYFVPTISIDLSRITFKKLWYERPRTVMRDELESWATSPEGVVLVKHDGSACTIPIDDMDVGQVERFARALRAWGEPI